MPRKKQKSAGRQRPADKAFPQAPAADGPAGDRREGGKKPVRKLSPAGIPDTIATIRAWHRRRVFAMEQRKKLDNALGAYIRTLLGWSLNLSEADRTKITKQATDLIGSGGGEWASEVAASAAASAPFIAIEAEAEKNMAALARQLPVWTAFGEKVRGFGPASLAVIVGEAGDLSNYANPAKLWKRMGLAVMDGVRQGGLPKGAPAEEWIAHGYNRKRRSLMWNIGDTIIKAQIRKVKDDAGEATDGRKALGDYGESYLSRKAYEIARDPEIKPIAAHRRAQRYMEKRLLKHLWQAWRRACKAVIPDLGVPAADNSGSPQGERRAIAVVESTRTLPGATIPAKAGRREAKPEPRPIQDVPPADNPGPQLGDGAFAIGCAKFPAVRGEKVTINPKRSKPRKRSRGAR